jgi:hypothetical protein
LSWGERSVVKDRLFRLGLYQYKVERALALYHDGVGSLGYIAEQLGLPKWDLIREARTRGIEPDFSTEMLPPTQWDFQMIDKEMERHGFRHTSRSKVQSR